MTRTITLSLALAATLFCLFPASPLAQSTADSSENSPAFSASPSNRLDLEFGYFTSRRQSFRELYGSWFDYGLNFQHRLNGRFSWSLHGEFTRLADQHEWKLRYWTVALTPMLIYNFRNDTRVQPLVGGGIGACYRNVTLVITPTGEVGERAGLRVRQQELSVSFTAMTGVDLSLGETLVLGGRAYFDFHPLGDPSKGDFGDTGGYHFTFRLGHKF